MAAALELDNRGYAAGRDGLPTRDATLPDATEQAIAAEISARASEGLRRCQHELDLYASRAARHAVGPAHQARIEAAGESALADYVALTRDDIDQLFLARDRVREASAELRRFRERHRLQRAARLVGPRTRMFRWLLLAVIVLAEAITNGLFLASASTAGVIGGVSQALAFALLNVGMMVLAGRWFRSWLVYRNVAVQLAGLVGLMAAAAGCLTLNLTLAHFRDLYAVAAGAPVPVAALLDRVLTHPLLLADFQSWLLAALGVGFAVVAFIDALGLADPYPGYERVAQAREQAVVDYAEAKADCLAGLMQRRDDALQAMQAAIDLLERSRHEYQLALQGQARLLSEFDSWLAHLHDVYTQLVTRYRDANRRSRTTPAPEWFGQAPHINLPTSPRAPTPPPSDPAVADAVAAHMRDYIARVNARYEDALEQHASVENLTTAGSA